MLYRLRQLPVENRILAQMRRKSNTNPDRKRKSTVRDAEKRDMGLKTFFKNSMKFFLKASPKTSQAGNLPGRWLT